MSSSTRTRLGIGGIILLVATVGAGLFVSTGSTEVVWATLVGIPVVVVGAIALYVRGMLTRTKTSEQQFVQKRAGSVAESFQSTLRTLNELRDTYPRWTPSLDAQADSIVADFRTQGVEFDPDSGSFEVTSSVSDADIQEFDRLETEVESFGDQMEAAFGTFVRSEVAEIESAFERLESADLIDAVPSTTVPDTDSVPQLRDTLDAIRLQSDEAVATATEGIREMSRGENRPDDLEPVESKLDAAQSAADRSDYQSAVESVLEAQDWLRDQFSGSFEAERESLTTLIETVMDSDVEQYVDADQFDTVRQMQQTVEGIDSALELSELTSRRATLRETCIAMVRSMESELEDSARTLRTADLPGGYYTEPDVVGESLADTLAGIDEMERFTAEFADGAARLTDALATTTTKASVVDAYDDFAGEIDETLQETGEVTGDDLPVRHAEQFLGLYNRRNPSVEFDPETGVLHRGDVEQYDVTVGLEYERGGEPRQATVELDGGAVSLTETIETRVAGSVTFEEVPSGVYTLSADPGVDEFGSVSEELTVEDEVETSVEFTGLSLRERVCDGFDEDMTDHLSAVDSQVRSTFEEQDYVSTAMELPVRDAYAPCLVAIWGEENGYDLTEFEDDIVVYDPSQVRREIENIVQYNLEAGEQLRFDEARENFLSVPVSDDVIRGVVSELDLGADVTTSATAIEIN
ncbi:hypothetical protein [Haloarcula sediminis]|uniref:hypothetical protein n=1 Tax=Haloarcula sediminis TaxID=3111777 RepID=UPI002D77B98B|nr:hypothetical protein [Haloarcula sp. CK38]